jgi:hypothetical protein
MTRITRSGRIADDSDDLKLAAALNNAHHWEKFWLVSNRDDIVIDLRPRFAHVDPLVLYFADRVLMLEAASDSDAGTIGAEFGFHNCPTIDDLDLIGPYPLPFFN